MDDKKMSCGQEVGMSSGEAPMPSLHENECTMLGEADGNSSIEPILSPDGSVLRMSSAEAHDHHLRKRFVPETLANKGGFEPYELCMVGSAPGNFKRRSVTTSVSLPTICKVPQRIRQANKDAFELYEPHIVSIGPFHHFEEEEFEKHKRLYRVSILSRNRNHPPLEDYHKEIKTLEAKARSCYSEDVGLYEDVGLDCNEFVEMMVLDGCFIVELFLRQKEEKEKKEKKSKDVLKPEKEQSEEEESKEDPIFSTIWMLPLIRYDLLLVENQIPFFVLEIIYKKACPGNGSLVELALDFFEPIIPNNKENEIKVSKDQINGRYFHLLHLFHSYLMPTPREKSKKCKILMSLCSKGSNEAELPISNTTIKMIPCAAELQLAGVKFKKKKDFSSFLDVKFSGGVLEIPHLCIDDYTNTFLRNLVALEQICYPRVETIHFTNYVGFMDCLVNTSKDVALLHRNGIIDHLLGSDEDVALLFNHLCVGIFNDFENNNYLSGIYKDVVKHYNTPWNMCWASLKHDYFSNPWSVISLIAASILLLLTITQTIFTIFPYFRPRS